MQVMYYWMVNFIVFVVNVVDLVFDVVVQCLVVFYLFVVWGSQLDQDGVVVFDVVFGQQFGKGFQLYVDVFGVVELVNIEQDFVWIFQFGVNFVGLVFDVVVVGSVVECVGVN